MSKINLYSINSEIHISPTIIKNNQNIHALTIHAQKRCTKTKIRDYIYLSTAVKVEKIRSQNVIKKMKYSRKVYYKQYKKFIIYFNNIEEKNIVESKLISVPKNETR